jgi:hypothetical protein
LLPKGIDRRSQDKKADFEFKALRGNGKNEFWQQTLDQAASCFNNLAESRLELEYPRFKRALRILLGNEFHSLSSLVDRIFDVIVVLGHIPSNPGMLGQVKIVQTLMFGMSVRPRCKKNSTCCPCSVTMTWIFFSHLNRWQLGFIKNLGDFSITTLTSPTRYGPKAAN